MTSLNINNQTTESTPKTMTPINQYSTKNHLNDHLWTIKNDSKCAAI